MGEKPQNHCRDRMATQWPNAVDEQSVPSLSKGHLRHQNVLKPVKYPEIFEKYQTMTKWYNDEVKFFKFNTPIVKRKQGYELVNPEQLSKNHAQSAQNGSQAPNTAQNHERSTRRARQKVIDYALMNEFDKFGTLTFDPKKCNAYDLDWCQNELKRWLKKQRENYGKFRYIVVSEYMKDGKVHFHLLMGDYKGKLRKTNLRGTGKNERQCYKITSWEKKYGFADIEDIADTKAIAFYITKYITKDFNEKPQNAKKYWCSKGLKTPKVTYDDNERKIQEISIQTDEFENEYAKIKTYMLL